MKHTRKQELTALNFGDDWYLEVIRSCGKPSAGNAEPRIDDFYVLIHGSKSYHRLKRRFPPEYVDTSVLNNLIQLVEACENGLDLTFDCNVLLIHWLNYYDIPWHVFRNEAGPRVAINYEQASVRFLMAPPCNERIAT